MAIETINLKKNYLKFRQASGTRASVDWSIDTDGVITLNGTSDGTTSDAYTPISYNITLPAGNYTLTSLNQNDQINTQQLYISYQDGSGTEKGTGGLDAKGTTNFTLTQQTTVKVYLFFYGGNTYNNVKMYPMVIEGTYNYTTVPSFIKSTGRLPQAYEEVEYLESTGTQYIDTGISPTENNGLKTTIKDLTIQSADFNFMGARTQQSRFAISYINGNYGFGWNSFVATNTAFDVTAKSTIELNYKNSGKFAVNGSDISTLSSTTISGLPNFVLFGQYSTNNINYRSYKIYGASISNGTTLVRDFVPCMRKSDNVYGMYDLVNSVFYTNSGTGTFKNGVTVVGNDTEKKQVSILGRLPNSYQEVEYLESTGTQYIDTNAKLATNSKYQFEMMFTSNDDIRWFGNYQSSSNSLVLAFKNGYIPCRVNQQWDDNYLNTISLNEKHLIEVETSGTGVKIYCDGTLHKQVSIAYSPNTNLNIGLIKEYSLTKEGLIGNLYSCKILTNDNLVRNFIPCYRKADNVAGLYDLVNDVFYTNAGTGTFAVGNNVFSISKVKTNILKPTNNLLKLKRSEWNSDSYQPTSLVTFDYDKLYYMAGSGYIRPYDSALNETITRSSVTLTQTSSSWWGIGFPFEVKPSTKYTISAKRLDGNKTKIMYVLYNADGSFGSYAQLTSNTSILDITETVTTGANTKTMIIVVAGITQGDIVYAYDIQVEEGQTATAFKPYGYEIIKI